jgi:4-amino-4-deoxy-L-arabinose transferase-like glycosyltransferase
VLPDRRSVAGVPLRELIALAVILGIAAILRFVALPARGQWDADQGHDMLTLLAMTQSGELPLLGPPTSIGDVHHGALYYYLLAPAAWLSNADPVAVTAMIALAGVAAVAVTWWLGRSIGGTVAGLVAALLMAVSASAVEESTFIWNPNLIPLASSIALVAAWRAWSGDVARPLAWVVAFGGAIVTMHCHVLGSIFLPAIVVPWVLDVRRRDGAERRRLLLAGAAGLLLLVLSYVPLLIHEVEFNFSETRAAITFVTGGGEPSTTSLPLRFVVIGLRVLAWPLVGLVTEAPLAAIVAAGGVIAAIAWRSLAGDAWERTASRWFGLTLLWTTAALSVAASGLATVVPRLPNDHYHAFADPIVFVAVGLGLAGLTRLPVRAGRAGDGSGRVAPRPGAILAGALVVAIVGFNLVRQPPLVSPDGGWPAGDAAAGRVLPSIEGQTDEPSIVLTSLPPFKSGDALRFPLVRRGADVPELWADPMGFELRPHVVLCAELFEEAIGAPCGGPAEDEVVAPYAQRLVDRFEAAPDRWVSVYLPKEP